MSAEDRMLAAALRIEEFRSWLKVPISVPLSKNPCPDVPSDHDYTLAREAGLIEARA